ncbi:hypothetical protein [Salinibacillus xinjiangensis]|uniref:Uncharacterized protein n=1 Tax=Salinibacillus xinjiangensis TaxID=1229268 RepID=A0A6G1X4S0_9BACI|nr:hypothetical protein [Salinibacillus xinjiangensis]MRG85896.1 hypothetical protein [Salinibacillus xinjiangensis]
MLKYGGDAEGERVFAEDVEGDAEVWDCYAEVGGANAEPLGPDIVSWRKAEDERLNAEESIVNPKERTIC